MDPSSHTETRGTRPGQPRSPTRRWAEVRQTAIVKRSPTRPGAAAEAEMEVEQMEDTGYGGDRLSSTPEAIPAMQVTYDDGTTSNAQDTQVHADAVRDHQSVRSLAESNRAYGWDRLPYNSATGHLDGQAAVAQARYVMDHSQYASQLAVHNGLVERWQQQGSLTPTETRQYHSNLERVGQAFQQQMRTYRPFIQAEWAYQSAVQAQGIQSQSQSQSLGPEVPSRSAGYQMPPSYGASEYLQVPGSSSNRSGGPSRSSHDREQHHSGSRHHSGEGSSSKRRRR